jgi:hypothetical protein
MKAIKKAHIVYLSAILTIGKIDIEELSEDLARVPTKNPVEILHEGIFGNSTPFKVSGLITCKKNLPLVQRHYLRRTQALCRLCVQEIIRQKLHGNRHSRQLQEN